MALRLPLSRSRTRTAALAAMTLVTAGLVQAPASGSTSHVLRVVGLGDSVMAAGGCPSCTSYLSTAAHRIAAQRGRSAAVYNYAVGGYRSVDVLHQLQTPAIRQQVRQADITVIEIGANDFTESSASNPNCEPVVAEECFTHPAATMQANLKLAVDMVRNLQRPGSEVVLMGYWNVFKDGQVGRSNGSTYVAVSDELTRWVNSMTWQVARQDNARYAQAYTALKGSGDPTQYLIADGDHPNAAGHAQLAQAIVDAAG